VNRLRWAFGIEERASGSPGIFLTGKDSTRATVPVNQLESLGSDDLIIHSV
jgi:hypothetical protein